MIGLYSPLSPLHAPPRKRSHHIHLATETSAKRFRYTILPMSSYRPRPVLAREDSLDGAGSEMAHVSLQDDSLASSSSSSSPPTLPAPLSMKRGNPKQLSLSLSFRTHDNATSFDSPLALPITPAPLATASSTTTTMDTFTPFTPGPPRTPALALNPPTPGGLKKPAKPGRLSLFTQPIATTSDVPPTPGGAPSSSRPTRPSLRLRSSSSATEPSSEPERTPSSRSSTAPLSFAPIPEYSHLSPPTFATVACGSSSSSSPPHSNYTSPSSSSPPLATAYNSSAMKEPSRPAEPYADGPVELIPGIFLGAEESVSRYEIYGLHSDRVRILNVAEEIDNPFASSTSTPTSTSGRVQLAEYPNAERAVDYGHLLWLHGEVDLARIPPEAKLRDLINGTLVPVDGSEEKWGFWQAITWMEKARREGVPILIHCQLGVSRSATLAIAYIMTLAVAGLIPELLGDMKGMQDVYDYVKAKSPVIGPNVSLVMQLVEFVRNLTTLLSAHSGPVQTSFPRANDMESEAEWAKRRHAFDEQEAGASSTGATHETAGASISASGSPHVSASQATPAVVVNMEEEARALDEAMRERKRDREGSAVGLPGAPGGKLPLKLATGSKKAGLTLVV